MTTHLNLLFFTFNLWTHKINANFTAHNECYSSVFGTVNQPKKQPHPSSWRVRLILVCGKCRSCKHSKLINSWMAMQCQCNRQLLWTLVSATQIYDLYDYTYGMIFANFNFYLSTTEIQWFYLFVMLGQVHYFELDIVLFCFVSRSIKSGR